MENFNSLKRSLRKELPSERHSEIKDIQMSAMLLDSVRMSHQSNRSGGSYAIAMKNFELLQQQHNPPPPISILEADNLFSPTAQFQDFDLSQYNSPSFAAGTHIGGIMGLGVFGGLRAVHQSHEHGIQRLTTSSSGRDSD